MSLEAGTYVSDLDAANPPGTDQKKQGDDHLRLIKSVLKATFPNADRAWRMPEIGSKSSIGTIASTDESKWVLCDTSGGSFTLTLPTPTIDGWVVRVMKTTTDSNVVFVAPPSGNISTNVGAIATVRVGVPFKEYTFVWTGGLFIEFDGLEEPATVLDYFAATAPVGYAFVYGQTLSGVSADYPKLYARRSSLVMPDLRGRTTFGKDDMGGSAASRLTTAGGGIDGATLDAAGGAQTTTMVRANLPNVTLTVTGSVAVTVGGQAAQGVGAAAGSTSVQSPGGTSVYATSAFGAMTATFSNGVSSSLNGNVAQTAMQTLPPGIVCNKIMRLC